MVKDSKVVLKFLIALFIFALAGCANQQPPSGGDVDKTPPTVVYSYPSDGVVNFKDNYFEIEFSEYVDKRTFSDAIFISPAIDGEMEISWTGKTATIEFPQGLKKDITYVVTIGTDVVDLNNKNRMQNSFYFYFSTGGKIDRRMITGNVYGKDIEGTMIFAYRFITDTSTYLNVKPDYISQAGKSGSYVLPGLAESVYRVYAVKDQFRDLIFQPAQDLIGIPYQDVDLKGTDSLFTDLDFFLFNADTTKPRIISAIMTDKNHILVTMSKEFDSSIVKVDNYFIVDSTDNKQLPIDYIFRSNSKKEDLVLVVKSELNEERKYHLVAKKLKDISDNITLNDFNTLIVSEKPDTSAPLIVKTVPAEKSKTDFKNTSIQFYFNDVIQSERLKENITFKDTLDSKVPFSIRMPDSATLEIIPTSELKTDKVYEINLNLKEFKDAAGNSLDSLYKFRFSTITGFEFTGLSGKVSSPKDNLVLVLQNSKAADKKYLTKPNKASEFEFNRVDAGAYNLWYFVDKDSSGSFDDGSVYPFRFAEEFHFYPDTINLRERWSLTDFLLKVKK